MSSEDDTARRPRAKRPGNARREAPAGARRPGKPDSNRPASVRLDARNIAAEVIERVLGDSAYASAALNAALERNVGLDERMRAQTTELVYTALRTKKSLLARLEAHAPKGLPRDPVLVSHLLVAATQILVLDHRTAPIAVDVAVSRIDALRGPRMAGFANAILRKVVAERDSFDRAAAVEANCPPWLHDALVHCVGAEEASLLLGVEADATGSARATHDHPIALRIRLSGESPEWLKEATPGRLSPLCRLVTRVGDPRKLAGYDEGRFVIQEEGAQLIALAVGAKPGERVLDCCAGRGQKTTLLAEQVGPNGSVCATDLHPRKLEALAEELRRLGLSGVVTTAVDFSRGTGGLEPGFDRVLVDAPCTGSGTLRKRPEIAARLGPSDPARLAELSTAILRNAASLLRPEGTLVFAVCSVLPEECEAVVQAVSDVLVPIPFDVPDVARALGEGATQGRLLPGRHGTDGYLLAHLRRR
ncbi:MAG: RsmB/NOP family class I SAM-dependent RNA methyltransferase [Polyangiaceae bacterium]